MKRHEFNFELLGSTSLLGLSISQSEEKYSEQEEWSPVFSISLGLIFITFTYKRVS